MVAALMASPSITFPASFMAIYGISGSSIVDITPASPPPPAPPGSQPPSAAPSSTLSTAAIIGIAVGGGGGLLLLVAIGVAVVLVKRRRSKGGVNSAIRVRPVEADPSEAESMVQKGVTQSQNPQV